MKKISFETNPINYLHWNIEIRENLAFLTMNVNEDGGMFDGYQLKLNSYDLSVDIELFDAIETVVRVGKVLSTVTCELSVVAETVGPLFLAKSV